MTNAEYMEAFLEDCGEQIEAERKMETRYRVVLFTSRSKGRGKSRRALKEVHLVADTWTRPLRWHEAHTVAWDVLASETYPNLEAWEAERKILREVGYET